MATNLTQRPRIASPWLVMLLAAVVLLIFYAAWPRGGLRERMMFSAAPSELSVAYLEAWLRVQPANPEFLSLLGEQYARLGRLDEAVRIAQRMDALNSEPMHRKAILLRLSVAEQQTFAIPASDPLRAAASTKLRAQLADAASLAWPTPDLQSLAQRAAAADAPQLAMQLYRRLAVRDPARHTQWNAQVSRYALFIGDYPHAADAWFREQDAAATLDAQRRSFLAGIGALQSGNMLNEALAAAEQHAGVLAEDKETLIVLLNVARAANRPDLARRYATALGRFAAAQPEGRAVLEYASFKRTRRAAVAVPQTPYAYMDGPQASGDKRLHFGIGSGFGAGTRGWGAVHLRRVANAAQAANPSAASGTNTGTASGNATSTKSAPATGTAANGDVAGLVFQSFVEAGDLASAQKIASEKVAKDPHSAVWLKRLAQVAEWNNASPLALKSWLAYAETSNDPAAWANVLRIAPMLNDDNAYLAALVHASHANPDNLKLVDDVVATYERLGLPNEALAFLAAHLRATQGDAIDDRMGTLSERAGRDDAALAIYRRLQTRSPNNATYALRTASLLYRHGDYKGAFDALQKARSGAKNDDEVVALAGFAMVSGAKAADTTGAKKGDSSASTEARTLPSKPTWGAYYGAASNVDIGRLGSTFNVVVIDADPGEGDDAPAFDAAQIAALKARGAKVLSYLNFGACEESRSWWSDVPAGFVSCRANRAARLGRYQGYPEYWMNPGNAQFQHLIVDYIAPRLVAAGVDGFMLDNFEVVSHGAGTAEGQCDAACRQGGLDLVATLRKRYPDRSIVLNNASTAVLRGSSGGVPFSLLVDGVFAEDVFLPSADASLIEQLRAWSDAAQKAGRTNFFVGTLDYASSCSATAAAQAAWNASSRAGFSPSVATVDLTSICWWPAVDESRLASTCYRIDRNKFCEVRKP